jgi:hypothetical protein
LKIFFKIFFHLFLLGLGRAFGAPDFLGWLAALDAQTSSAQPLAARQFALDVVPPEFGERRKLQLGSHG